MTGPIIVTSGPIGAEPVLVAFNGAGMKMAKLHALLAMKTEEDVKKADGRLFKGPADTRALIHRLHQIRKGAL